MSAAAGVPCVLCAQDGGRLIWRNDALRVIDVGDPDLPGYTRVIWQAHVREMTDLTRAERTEFMEVVYLVESMQRHWLKPDKINIASLGNQTPHLHWHIMPRWKEDPWFPDSIWAARRDDEPRRHAHWKERLGTVSAHEAQYFAALSARLHES